jgi:hypothetical protein
MHPLTYLIIYTTKFLKIKIKIEMNYTYVKSTLQKMHNFIR